MRRLGLLAALAALAIAAPAPAYWSVDGTGAGSAASGSLGAATITVPPASVAGVLVTWTAQASLVPSSAGNSAITYAVERRAGAGAFAPVASGACAGALPRGTAACLDAVPASGSYSYRVVARLGGWTAPSAVAGPVVVTLDLTAPTVSAIARAAASPTNAAGVSWDVSFSESVTGVNAADFALARTGTLSGGSITSVTGSGSSYTVTASTGSGSGTLGLNLVDDDSIVDTAGVPNPLGGTGAGNGNFTGQSYAIDRVAPAATAVALADPNPTSAASVRWTVSFGEAVSGVDAADFALAPTGSVTGAGLTSVSGGGTTYTVTASTGTGAGTLGLNLVANGTIVDLAGNALAAGRTGDVYTVDRSAPALVSLQMLDTNANGKVDRVVATFSEALAASTDSAPWALANVPSGGTLAGVSIAGSAATLTISEGAGAASTAVGSFTVALSASATGVRDPAGNQASFAATAPADLAAPVLLALQMLDNDVDGKVDRVSASFSETLATTSGNAPWTLAGVPSGGSLSFAFSVGSAATLLLTEGSGAADTSLGTFTVALAANVNGVKDAAGNLGSFAATAPVDKAGPVPLSIADSDTTSNANGLLEIADTLTVTFSEAVSGVPASTPVTEARPASGNATLSIAGFTNGALNLGSTNYMLTANSSVTFSGSSALSNAGKTVTITVGACSSAPVCVGQTRGNGTSMVYLPAATIVDSAANAAAGSIATGFRVF